MILRRRKPKPKSKIDWNALVIGKGKTRKQEKSAEDRREAALVKKVRARCVERDGYCRMRGFDGNCEGPSEWAHLEDQRRGRTMGMDAEERHTPEGSCMMCRRHHRAYDRFDFWLRAVIEALGAEGILDVVRRGETVSCWQV